MLNFYCGHHHENSKDITDKHEKPFPKSCHKMYNIKTNLDETNFFGIAVEALSAAHEPVLSNQSMRVTTYTAGV